MPGAYCDYLLISFVVVYALILLYLLLISYVNKFVQVVYIADVLPTSYNSWEDLPNPPAALINVY